MRPTLLASQLNPKAVSIEIIPTLGRDCCFHQLVVLHAGLMIKLPTTWGLHSAP